MSAEILEKYIFSGSNDESTECCFSPFIQKKRKQSEHTYKNRIIGRTLCQKQNGIILYKKSLLSYMNNHHSICIYPLEKESMYIKPTNRK
jgi:hypothetical protein